MRRLAAAAVALMLAGAPAATAAAGPAEAVAESSARLSGAVAALAAAPAAEDRVAALAAALAAQEAALAGLRDGVIGAEARERELMFDLQRRGPEISRLLLAMEALSRSAEPASGLHPGGPLAAARASAMIGWLTPALRSEARTLGDRLAAIDAARALRAQGLDQLAAGLAEQTAARDALVAALAAADTDTQTDAPTAVPASLPREAQTLSDLADRLAALGAAPGALAASDEPLALRWPVTGQPLRGYGEADAAGVRRPGLLLQTAPLALVTAPAAAEVRYAGPFLDYGYVVVLQPRADVLIVLAGIATLETRTGARVGPGAPLGLLGGRPLDAQEYLMLGQSRTGETPGETLYIELRHGQGPVDPSTWFEDRNG